MHVRQGVSGGIMTAGKPGQVEKSGARLNLLLDDRGTGNPQHMVKARVRVHGLSANPTILPADPASARPTDMVMTVTIGLTPGAESGFSGNLVLPGFTAALRVDLQSITLEDGSVRSFSDACRAVPDGVMPVGGSQNR